MHLNRPIWILMFAAAVIFFTSSFDSFLSIDLGPNIRLAQLVSLVLVIAALLTHRMGLSLEMPLGAPFLLAWCGIQLAFVPVADFWQKSLAYCVWLVLNIALVFAMVNVFASNFVRLHTLLKLYLSSFVFAATFGIIQFILPIVGGPALLIEQWWIPGSVPRVNGFSFEPSYYATYLIMGLVSLGSLRRSGVTEFRTWAWTFSYLLMIIAMILCSSRIGIAFALLELSIQPLRFLAKIIRRPSLILGFHVSGKRFLIAAACVWITYIAIGKTIDWVSDDPETVRIIVSGTGLLGTAAHSVDEREEHFGDTLEAIADHPWMGSSLGGVTESVASHVGFRPQNFEETKRFEGQSTFAEVVAASGIPGSIPFFCFVVLYIVSPLKLARTVSTYRAAWLRALVLSLVFEWAILQFNQNILRLYLWIHIAMLATVFAAVRSQYGEPVESLSLVGAYGSPNLLA
jgi:hypothetical protein